MCSGAPRTDEARPYDDVRRQLELDELRYKIRDLRAPWWQRPSVTAPIATIVAAILGLIWGVASGFFDVARRELAVSKRELEAENKDLKANRDRQSILFNAERAKQNKVTADLNARESFLRKELDRLDQPVLYDTTIDNFQRVAGRIESFDIELGGMQLGEKRGSATILVAATCRSHPGTEIQLGTLPTHITWWSPATVRMKVGPSDLAKPREALRRDQTAKGCTAVGRIFLERADGKRTNIDDIDIIIPQIE